MYDPRLLTTETPQEIYAASSDAELARLVDVAEYQAKTSTDPVVLRIAKDSRQELDRRNAS